MSAEKKRNCGRCQKLLPLSAFRRYGNGFQSYCRACQREYDAAWYRANRYKRRSKVEADRRGLMLRGWTP